MARPKRQDIIDQALVWIGWYRGNCRLTAKPRVTKGERPCLDPDLKPRKGWWVTFELFVDKEEFDK